jgi:hypothetical protein
MNSCRAIFLILAVAVAAAVLTAGDSERIAEQVAARLNRSVEKSPRFAGATSVHRTGAQVTVWVFDTLPASARADLARVVASEGKPLHVKLLDLKLGDFPGGDSF